MTEQPDWREALEARIADEIGHIVTEFRARRGTDITVIPADNGGIDHMYAEGEILVREEYLTQVLQVLGLPDRDDLETDPSGRVRRVIAGYVLLTLNEPHDSVAAALDLIDQRLGRHIATPNHVLTVAPNGQSGSCPATEPEQVYADSEPFPSLCPDGGRGVLVYLADTGLLRDASRQHRWLAGVRVGDEAEDLDPKSPMTGTIPPYTGHGTFVAGVLRCMAPDADVIVTNAFAVAGSELESDLVARLEAALGLGVDIFHLTIACVSRHDLPLLAFGEWLRRLRESKGTICIAAAGNSDSRRPSWPAAFGDVIAVGALGSDWCGRASFSNFGPWVDVYAPGRDLVNAFATGDYECYARPYAGTKRQFYGMAKWSGTSFATPIVSGLIAARMSRTGENARDAAAALLAQARSQAVAGTGPVLLPRRGGEHPGGTPG
jgi:subtilisin family serine protease